MKVGKKLKELKKIRNLKLKDIAQETGLSVSYISDILNERTSPSLNSLEKLVDSLGVTPSYVMEASSMTYQAGPEAQLHELIQDFCLWPDQDQTDLLDYIQAKKELIRLAGKL